MSQVTSFCKVGWFEVKLDKGISGEPYRRDSVVKVKNLGDLMAVPRGKKWPVPEGEGIPHSSAQELLGPSWREITEGQP